MEKHTTNKLLGRKELVFNIESVTNPGIAGATKAVAEKLKVEENLVVVKRIDSKFGRNNFVIEANVYNDLAHKEMVEPKPKKKKEAGK